MNKLSLDALKERAEEIATDELLAKISGGTDNDCHDDSGTELEYKWEIMERDKPKP